MSFSDFMYIKSCAASWENSLRATLPSDNCTLQSTKTSVDFGVHHCPNLPLEKLAVLI